MLCGCIGVSTDLTAGRRPRDFCGCPYRFIPACGAHIRWKA